MGAISATVLSAPQHAYTRHLLAAEPRGKPEPPAADAATVMSCRDLKVWYPIKGTKIVDRWQRESPWGRLFAEYEE